MVRRARFLSVVDHIYRRATLTAHLHSEDPNDANFEATTKQRAVHLFTVDSVYPVPCTMVRAAWAQAVRWLDALCVPLRDLDHQGLSLRPTQPALRQVVFALRHVPAACSRALSAEPTPVAGGGFTRLGRGPGHAPCVVAIAKPAQGRPVDIVLLRARTWRG